MNDLEKKVLAFLSHGYATRNEIVAGVGVSRTQLGRVLPQLMASGVVASVGAQESAHGRHAELLGLQNDVAMSVGIAVSRMDIRCVITNYLGGCLLKKSLEHSAIHEKEWLQVLKDFLGALERESNRSKLDLSTVVRCAVALPQPMPGEESELTRRVCAAVQKALPAASVFVDNTMRMGALGEAFFGAGSAYPNQIYVGISGGVAASAIVDGRLIDGQGGIGGELGHISVPGATAHCHCGKRGCLETLLSYHSLCDAAGVPTVKELRASYLNRDDRALATVNKAIQGLAHALSGTILTLGVTSIILGGSVSAEFPEIAQKILPSYLAPELLPSPQWKLCVAPAVLGSWAPAWGAACAHSALR